MHIVTLKEKGYCRVVYLLEELQHSIILPMTSLLYFLTFFCIDHKLIHNGFAFPAKNDVPGEKMCVNYYFRLHSIGRSKLSVVQAATYKKKLTLTLKNVFISCYFLQFYYMLLISFDVFIFYTYPFGIQLV